MTDTTYATYDTVYATNYFSGTDHNNIIAELHVQPLSMATFEQKVELSKLLTTLVTIMVDLDPQAFLPQDKDETPNCYLSNTLLEAAEMALENMGYQSGDDAMDKRARLIQFMADIHDDIRDNFAREDLTDSEALELEGSTSTQLRNNLLSVKEDAARLLANKLFDLHDQKRRMQAMYRLAAVDPDVDYELVTHAENSVEANSKFIFNNNSMVQLAHGCEYMQKMANLGLGGPYALDALRNALGMVSESCTLELANI